MYCPRKCKRLKGHSLIEGNMACCSGRADIWGRGYASQLCPESENRQEVIWQDPLYKGYGLSRAFHCVLFLKVTLI